MKAQNRGFGSSFRGVGVVSLSFLFLSLFRETWRWCLEGGGTIRETDMYIRQEG